MDGEILISRKKPEEDQALKDALASQRAITEALIEKWIQEGSLREGADPLGR